MKSCLRSVCCLAIVCVLTLVGTTSLVAQINTASNIPAWNARGVGPLPWQGISAIQVSSDGGRIVLGTIAPPEDPKVIVLDATGKVLEHYAVGQRWIDSIAILPKHQSVLALCTHANGTANDFPTVFLRGANSLTLPPLGKQEGFVTAAFHYGDHSNHLGLKASQCEAGIWSSGGKSAMWFEYGQSKPAFTANLPLDDHAVSTTAAVLPNGTLVMGHAVPIGEGVNEQNNLFALKPGERQPLWARKAISSLPSVELPERGVYGAPTRDNGQKQELEQWDIPVTGPLSLALHATPDGTLSHIATADYRGWQRWVRSSATMKKQNIGTRFIPARPVVSVLNGDGELIRRFDADKFTGAAWLELRFLANGKKLIAWPHRWNSRGLGGSAFLPADPDARHVYLLDVETGEVSSCRMPTAVVDLAILSSGEMIVSCWNGECYRLGATQFDNLATLPKPVLLGGPALLAVAGKSQAIIAARADGVVIGLDADLHEEWRCDLNTSVPRADKPWVNKANAEPVGSGLWGLPGGRTESDLGGQRVIEAPDGLILIEGHAGLSFEREWAAMQKSGLDPMRVKYVLATHEHGDHSPGAYLWRVTTGAQFVCSEEMAYTLQHHIPLNSGYGFHPPVPTDVQIKEDSELDLAGLKVRAIRVPGHTAGSMAWSFEQNRVRYLATGDLIMPRGPLGYSGSINFSAYDVLASLKKLQALKADLILPGHGKVAPPEEYLDEGIAIGTRVGWGKIPPVQPDPRFRISDSNVIVAAWNIGARSAAFGDFNGDRQPDIAVVTVESSGDDTETLSPGRRGRNRVSAEPSNERAIVQIFLNQSGRFNSVADKKIPVPGIAGENLKIVVAELNGDALPDLMIADSFAAAVLLSQVGHDDYAFHKLPIGEAIHIFAGDDPKLAPQGVRITKRFGSVQEVIATKSGRLDVKTAQPELSGSYLDLRRVDLNNDGKLDTITSYGQILLNEGTPTNLLPIDATWRFFAVGDFNGDKRPDFFSTPIELALPAAEYLNTGDKDRPFNPKPNQELLWHFDSLKKQKPDRLVRESIAVADWNGDGRDDLLFAMGQGQEIHILPGSATGLDGSKRQVITLDYHLHFETGLYIADFNGDKKLDIASFGYTATGVGSSGPLAVYVWCQP